MVIRKWYTFMYALTSYALTSSNIDRFSNVFYYRSQENICNNNVTKDPTTPQVCRYTSFWNVSILKTTIENKTTSVATHFKKLTKETTCLLSQLLFKVTVASCSFYIKCSTYVSALLLDDARLKCVVTEVALFSIVAFKTLTFHNVV